MNKLTFLIPGSTYRPGSAKIPSDGNPRPRIQGYLNSLLNGGNLVEDIDLHEFYEHLRKIVSGDLFDAERLRIILDFNLGKYNKLILYEFEWEKYIGREDIDSLCPAN